MILNLVQEENPWGQQGHNQKSVCGETSGEFQGAEWRLAERESKCFAHVTGYARSYGWSLNKL